MTLYDDLLDSCRVRSSVYCENIRNSPVGEDNGLKILHLFIYNYFDFIMNVKLKVKEEKGYKYLMDEDF